MKKLLPLLLISFLLPIQTLAATAARHSGKIYLQVEAKGEAWYVNPDNLQRYFLGRPNDAFAIMRSLGLGISNNDIRDIPVGVIGTSALDSDNDGLSDLLEDALGTDENNPDTDGDSYPDAQELVNGYDPLQAKVVLNTKKNIVHLKGKILLQVEKKGEAWYVNPGDGKRYFLGRPDDALFIMRLLGVGITNADLATIDVYEDSNNQVTVAGCGSALMEEYKKENRDAALMLANRQEFKAVYDCLKESYENCVVSTGTLNQHLFNVEYKILGKKNGLCDVQVSYSSDLVPEYNGKSMICHLENDNGRPLFIEVVNYPQCEGSLIALIYPTVLNDYRIGSYTESMGYSDAGIVWMMSITVVSTTGESTGTTTFTIDDEGYRAQYGGQSSF